MDGLNWLSAFAPYFNLISFVWTAIQRYAETPEGKAQLDTLIADLSDDGVLNNSQAERQTASKMPRVINKE